MSGFEEVYDQHLRAVFRYALKLVGRREIAEELTSDAFITLWQSFDRIDTTQLPGWLFTVVRNRATDHWRRTSVEHRYLAALTPEPEAAATNRTAFLDSLNAAPALRPIHRAVLILRYVQGMERSEIAAHLGLSETQVKGHLQYAHKLLRRELIESHEPRSAS